MILFEVYRLRLESKSGYVPTVYKVGKRNVHRLLVRLYIILGIYSDNSESWMKLK